MGSVEILISLGCLLQLGHALSCHKCTYGTTGCGAEPFDSTSSDVGTDVQYLDHPCDFCYSIFVPQDDESVKAERGCAQEGVYGESCSTITYTHTDGETTENLEATKCICIGDFCNGDDYDSGTGVVGSSVGLLTAVMVVVQMYSHL